ncbi:MULTISPECIES: AGE family epimerase/isomerase [Faecalicatena]|nr:MULTISPECIES: AGE family epimerase/isomerase [Faecalicatena]MCI6466700.1 AGE family epimerase/isomerase [Faecalicatena sp.]MDY5620674.1 AGE family epimerase/isomerase [Lachnospiraceae bacterium]
MEHKVKGGIASCYKEHIQEEVMPFWDARCIDKEYGGYLTCFDREGNLTDDNKYGWFQGRQLYVYSLLYNKVEQKEEWLFNARHGYEFLVKHVYAGNGRWNYMLDRKGRVLSGTVSIFSDFHILHGIAEYLKMEGERDRVGLELLNTCFDVMEQNMFNPEFKEIYENTWSPKFIWHDMYLTCLATTETCAEVLGIERTQRLLRECVDKIENWFARDEYQVIFEAVTRDNKIDLETDKGRFVNPGHMHESAWFCMKAGKMLADEAIVERGIELVRWANRVGKDKVHGGIISYADALGNIPTPIDWFKETNSLWDEKVWWPNAEALAAYAIAYQCSGDEFYLQEFLEQSDYCRKNFYDVQYGEWYERLEYDGRVKNSDKGTPWKCAFHLVRALVFVWEAFNELEE